MNAWEEERVPDYILECFVSYDNVYEMDGEEERGSSYSQHSKHNQSGMIKHIKVLSNVRVRMIWEIKRLEIDTIQILVLTLNILVSAHQNIFNASHLIEWDCWGINFPVIIVHIESSSLDIHKKRRGNVLEGFLERKNDNDNHNIIIVLCLPVEDLSKCWIFLKPSMQYNQRSIIYKVRREQNTIENQLNV